MAPTPPPANQPGQKYDMQLQPETRPITKVQLVHEARGIYAGLVMVEKKCMEIDQQQGVMNSAGRPMPGPYPGDDGLEGDLGLCGLAYISGVSFPHTIFCILTNYTVQFSTLVPSHLPSRPTVCFITQGNSRGELSNEQWQGLIAIHRLLLHKHHDFFLASQHPSASDQLKDLAGRYAMLARLWRHGIPFLLGSPSSSATPIA
jgi:hypothetical protein